MTDPFRRFAAWFEVAKRREKMEQPNQMCLSTVGPTGRPEGRMVLLKRHGPDGFVFFTNLDSAKGRSLAKTPWAALTLYWERTGRQVRIVGRVAPIGAAEADAYFQSRPRAYQLGAWASRQSTTLRDRAQLVERFAAYRKKYAGKTVPRPAYWSGFKVLPETMEFWKSRPSRLHDRLQYTKTRGGWKIARLAP